MTGHIFIALAAALICVLLIRLLQRIMLTPVKPGRSSRQYIYIAVKGREPALEIWMRRPGLWPVPSRGTTAALLLLRTEKHQNGSGQRINRIIRHY